MFTLSKANKKVQIFSNILLKNYAGTQRVFSKIGTTENLGDYLQDWVTQGTGGPVNVVNSSFEVLENAEEPNSAIPTTGLRSLPTTKPVTWLPKKQRIFWRKEIQKK